MTDLMFDRPVRVEVVAVRQGDSVLVLLPGNFNAEQADRLRQGVDLPAGVKVALVHRPEMPADAMPAVLVFRPE